MTFINLTPHAIHLNSGEVYSASGQVARVSSEVTMHDDGFYRQSFSDVIGLPESKKGTYYIVSAMVLQAANSRQDLIAPATSHPDCIRNDKGHIVSVPGFVRNSF